MYALSTHSPKNFKCSWISFATSTFSLHRDNPNHFIITFKTTSKYIQAHLAVN
ncbi:hypothetical protein ACERII_05455 [Evansella sp. AB-rgal1]|uniref:hypothetical protein n=1 Tax=Evansella sp. AB-rgal1 TaxID=3242696 RepID=UPI00359E6D8C